MSDSKTQTQEKPAEKPVKETEASKPKKKTKKLEPFDIDAFVKDHGGEHWIRGEDGNTKFDHPQYKLVTHAVMNEPDGCYYIVNTYQKDGVTSLGKSGKGITKYPLKGHEVTYTVSQTAKKVSSRGQEKVRKGTKTADEVRKHWQKSGYIKQN